MKDEKNTNKNDVRPLSDEELAGATGGATVPSPGDQNGTGGSKSTDASGGIKFGIGGNEILLKRI